MAQVTDAKGRAIDFDAAVNLMDNGLRERLHSLGFEDDQSFLKAYAAAHKKQFGEEFAPYAGGAW